MENSVDILDELRELSPVIAGMKKVNVFTVPAGYFENLSEDILTGIVSEKGTSNNSVSDFLNADVPHGYFDTLADTILGKIKTQNASDELRTLSPMLYSIQGENVFEVPQGYFDSFADIVVALVKPQQTKVVTMRRRSNTFIKYAVAAAFTGVMALGVFKFTNTTKQSDDPVIALGKEIAKENRFDEELAKVTDADIVKFLEANGSDVKSAIVANSVDENELPSQEEYLLDDKALDKYLNSINVNELKN
ncbi:MAG: hypothetical protein ABI666_03595 [Ferruginibacter sp.]